MSSPEQHDPAPVPATGDAMALLARHGKSFRFAGRLLPRAMLEDAAGLYAFCRHVDDIADERSDDHLAAQDLAAIRAALSGNAPAPDRATRAFLDLAAARAVPLEAALDLVDGVAGDIGPVSLADEAALDHYCYQVAGTVGLMMCPLIGVRDPKAAAPAKAMGMAMQMTNIARDVVEDASKARVYLPADWIGGAGPADILSPPDEAAAARIRAAVARLLDRAELFYDAGYAGLGFIPRQPRLAIATAASVYRAIGLKIRARGCDVWQDRAVVGTGAKVAHALAGLRRLAGRGGGERRERSTE